ncbi:MAG: hypothetical protein JNJ48_06310 [Phycisphaerae bacterium]|nr:hypothetical protein [Phycisphaerae bacterium]
MPPVQLTAPAGAVVLCPMEVERAAVARALSRAGMGQVEVIRTGIGRGAVLAALDTVARRSPRPDLVLLAGACGGLTACDEVPPIARIVDEHGRSWRRFVGADPVGVTLVAVDRIVSTPAEKAALARATQAAIVDMESHAFAERCEALGLTWGVVRGVSDTPHETLPGEVMRWIAPDGRTLALRAAGDMLRRPSLIPPMVRVLRRARRVLPAVGQRVVATIAGMSNRLLPELITPLPIPDAGVAGIILFGGSFDPPHLAHVRQAALVRDRLAEWLGVPADTLWILYTPAARSPHKDGPPTASPLQRVEMLRLALRALPASAVWTDELDRAAADPSAASYSVDTARHARGWLDFQGRRDVQVRWLMGADQAAELHRWREPRSLVALAEPLVMLRPPEQTAAGLLERLRGAGFWRDEELAAWPARIVELPLSDASATEARRALAAGDQAALQRLLDPRVLAFIRERGLYGAPVQRPGR